MLETCRPEMVLLELSMEEGAEARERPERAAGARAGGQSVKAAEAGGALRGVVGGPRTYPRTHARTQVLPSTPTPLDTHPWPP